MNQSHSYLMLKTRLQKVVSENVPSVNNFATKCKIPQSTIHRWMDGNDKNPPGLDMILKLAEYLPTLNLRWLIQGETSQSPSANNSMQVNEPLSNYDKSVSTKDSLIELQQSSCLQVAIDLVIRDNLQRNNFVKSFQWMYLPWTKN